MKVIDLCAGAGGKTLHLAALMRNRGKIRAFDVEVNKLSELNKERKRAKVQCETACIDEEVLKIKHGPMALIDAPCVVGHLKTQSEIKWQLISDRLEELLATQRQLLQQAVDLIQKKENRLPLAPYSSENQKQTAWF